MHLYRQSHEDRGGPDRHWTGIRLREALLYVCFLTRTELKSDADPREQRWANRPNRSATDVVTLTCKVLKSAKQFNAATEVP